MIFCNLKGGIGNMLFQIATAKSMSIDKNVDCSFPNLEEHLGYLNLDLNHNPKLNHAMEYKKILSNCITEKYKGYLKSIKYPFNFKKIETPDDHFFIDGFFQSEKYFSHNRNKIIDFLKCPSDINKHILDKYSDLLNLKSTSIHVRRGDYLNLSDYHIVQDINYYIDSINMLSNDTELFIVFSDDIDWCRENLNFQNLIFIENEKDYIELYLMSKCKNNIISNSSFSWWGAWLNENVNKKVIAPKKWFGSKINEDDSDIIPEDWIKI
jgi:hypothetical protein